MAKSLPHVSRTICPCFAGKSFQLYKNSTYFNLWARAILMLKASARTKAIFVPLAKQYIRELLKRQQGNDLE
jgi:hypothetical protein